MLLSIIIPVYNSENSIRILVEKLMDEMKNIQFEIILVVDGSPDKSEQICTELAQKNTNINFISLRKNFGEFNAIMCGLNHVSGQYAVMIDDDFQQAPSEIYKLLDTIQTNDFDVVYGRYEDKKHSLFRNSGTWFVNKITTILFHKPIDLYLSSFKIIKKELVEEMIKYKGLYPYLDGLIFQITNNIGQVKVIHQSRKEGESNYTFKKLAKLLLSVIFGYSLVPIRIFYVLGLILFILGCGGILGYFLQLDESILTSLILLVSSIQLLSIAFIGEYIGKSYLMQANFPQFSIKKSSFKND